MKIIKIYSDTSKGCIFFDGSTVEPKFLGTIQAIPHPTEADRVIIYRLDRLQADGVSFRSIFKRLKVARIANRDDELLVDTLGYTRDEVVTYINEQSSALQAVTSTRPALGEVVGFKLDATNTTIMVNNGESFGINTLKASVAENGLIQITSTDFSNSSVVYFEEIDHTAIEVNEAAVSGGAQTVVNVLNELFTAGPFEAVVISDPYATMIADVGGVDTTYTLEGNDAIDPIGDDIFTYDGVGYANYAGLKSVDVIDQKGEYFTFDIRGMGTIGFGLVLTDDTFTDELYSGNASYADPASFAQVNSAHYGFQFSHWFHATPKGSWTNYGANTSYSMQAGWSNWDQKQDWIDGNPVKIRVGLDENGYISISSKQDDGSFVVHARSGYPVPQGAKFHLGIKSQTTSARVYSIPKVHLLEPEAPTMYFRYIESPDGNFEYPLFATEEEAKYYHKVLTGHATGIAHTHTYVDDPTGTTWYMPDNGQMTGSNAPYNMVFDGQTVLFTGITSLTNGDLVPPTFTYSDITQQEGSAINIQVQPQDVGYTSSVSGLPAGLTFTNGYLIQGTLAEVASDTTSTVTVTRTNSYGSTNGTFDITVTNLVPVTTNDTPWTKALDFSGSNEHAKQTNPITQAQALRLGGYGTAVANNADNTKTADSGFCFAWATAIVFRIDGHNSNQHIWNMGSGSGNSDKNIYLRLSAARELYFGWGKGSDNNECLIHNYLQTPTWYGVYIAFKGGRFNYGDLTDANLADAFDIRMISGVWDHAPTLADNKSTAANWTNGGNNARTDLTITGDFTIGGRGSNRSFHGQVASFVSTTLKRNDTIPTDAEILMVITDPKKWLTDYKVGNTYRYPNTTSNYTNFQIGDTQPAYATQVWLMGDGSLDSYSNMIRNEVQPTEQNYTKLNLISMVSNDIQNVSIDGLT